MKILILVHCFTILLISPAVIAQGKPDGAISPERAIQQANQAANTRHAFRGSAMPDGLAFQTILHKVSNRWGGVPWRTVHKIKYGMQFDSDEEAWAFIAILDDEHAKLSRTFLEARDTVLCHSKVARTKQQMFREVNSLKDMGIDLSAAAYDEFLVSLSSDYADRFDAWIQDGKRGASAYYFQAESSLAVQGKMPLAYYQDECFKIDQKLKHAQ